MPNRIVGNENGQGSYSFNAASKTVTITGIKGLAIQHILNITNLTKNALIYNPFVSGSGYTSFVDGVLTLVFDTTSHDDDDVLLITYNNDDEQQTALVDMAFEIRSLYNIIANPIYAEGGSIKINPLSTMTSLGSVGTVSTVTTVTTVTTVATVSNITNLGGVTVASALTERLMNIEFDNIRKNYT